MRLAENFSPESNGYKRATAISHIFKHDKTVGFRASVLLIVALLFMCANHYSAAFQYLRSKLSLVVLPLQYAVSVPIGLVDWVITDISSYHRLLEENTNMRSTILLLNAKLQKQQAIESENQQLFALLQSSSSQNEKVTQAELLAVSPDPFVREIVINKGSNDNVSAGQPILDAYGVMGQVVQAGPLTSRVLLITDPKSATPVQIQRNGIRAIAVGDPTRNLLKLEYVTSVEDVQVGDELVTSGLGLRYPFGYPVGTVVSVEKDSGDDFDTILIEPKAHLNQSRLVLIVWSKNTEIAKAVQDSFIDSDQTSSKTGKNAHD